MKNPSIHHDLKMNPSHPRIERVVLDVLGPQLAVHVHQDAGVEVAELDPHDWAEKNYSMSFGKYFY